ncbi:tyrosine/serine/threonine protein phosphatase PPS1 [Aspergillus tanneri]|uniref:Tyrosine/serine/threonine protein phosphatase pps1 n=1 Tax=Aspergillus tanneri TaxID=1220188 RepID=A0A5M9N4J7_9EURO|nr:tyrosine/serine/threonine protein phosphatase pps1 [Aspergillus tanneri]KAA8652514.1 tyrosine/serine/threonine protein phosphatase pps1 [Aspergillus tanneri]
MATVVVQQQTLRHSTPPPTGKSPALSLNKNSSPIPNKHLPVCPSGSSSITSQPTSLASKAENGDPTSSLLYPPDNFPQISDSYRVYGIEPEQLASALAHWASQPLPDPNQVFPWLHGLHPDNHLQLGFFTHRKRSLRRTPRCWRGITIIKVGGDLSSARIKGAVSPEEVLESSGMEFLAVDPREGFSVRNFQIQTAKLAALSDIVLYRDESVSYRQLLDAAEGAAIAQARWQFHNDPEHILPAYNTFVVSCPFSEIEKKSPSLVAINSQGHLTGHVMDFFQWERIEMCEMSRASEVSTNVWQGPTPDSLLRPDSCQPTLGEPFDLLIESSDQANIPGPRYLARLDKQLELGPQRLDFPSSGSILLPSGENRELDDLVSTIRWIYYLANPDEPDHHPDANGDITMTSLSQRPRKILMHCPDGYTESSLLVIAYVMFAEGIPAHDAWLRLHCDKKRNFFAYPSDVTFLTDVQDRLLRESPATRSHKLTVSPAPSWFDYCDGSLPKMLWELGIRRVLSIGESVTWNDSDIARMGSENIMHINRVQDNGIDPLTQEFDRCLEFIR